MTTNHEDTTAAPTAADPATAAATAPAAAVAPPAATTPPASDPLITPPADTPPTDPNAWLPEKFRVTDAEGKIDEAASARKLSESYTALERLKGSVAPATPAEYAIAPAEGSAVTAEDMAAFVADPLCKTFLEGGHKLGMSNELANYVMNRYLEIAPELIGADKQLSADEAKAELGKLWADPDTQGRNIASVTRAIEGFGGKNQDLPGSAQRLYAKYGTDPDFIAFAAAVAGEMKEDTSVVPAGLPSEVEVVALAKSKAYWDENDPKHIETKQRVKDYYDRKHGTTRK